MMAKRNVDKNHMKNISLYNMAVGKQEGRVSMESEENTDISAQAKQAGKGGEAVGMTTLERIAGENSLQNAVLKVDCEGGEYEILLETKNDVLRKFQAIMVEYHYGQKNLVEKLSDAGFDVISSVPSYYYEPSWGCPHARMGMIRAQRKELQEK